MISFDTKMNLIITVLLCFLKIRYVYHYSYARSNFSEPKHYIVFKYADSSICLACLVAKFQWIFSEYIRFCIKAKTMEVLFL
jgi:hypothetical protein